MYSLVLILMLGTTPNQFVIDSNMSREDCGMRIVSGEQFVPFGEGLIDFDPSAISYICELQDDPAPVELPPCEFEDSDNCTWDAKTRGNGQGRSFTNIEGQIFYHLN